MTDRELLDKARTASYAAYAPYSNVAVGAAIQCADGTVYTGCTVENSSLNNSLCAERIACAKAVSDGKTSFRRIAIFADTREYHIPCGACRQFLAEFSKENDIEVLCQRADSRYVSYKLSKLLPYI